MAFVYAITLLLAATIGAFALGRRAGGLRRDLARGASLGEAGSRALEALGVGLILVRDASVGRAPGVPSVRGNAEARRLFGLGPIEPGSDPRDDAVLASALSGRPELAALLAAGEGKAEFLSGEGSLCRKIEARALSLRGRGKGTVLVLSDITASAALLEELSTLASQDALTGLYNRRRFDELGSRDIELSRRSLLSVGVIMLDIDLFKRVNDEHGHSAGDEVLKSVTRACKAALRTYDILSRYGGEEFAALLPGSGAEESLAVAERLRACVAALVLPCEGGNVSVTVSLGVYSGIPTPDDDLASYMRRADEALYRSKALGRNMASYWQPIARMQCGGNA